MKVFISQPMSGLTEKEILEQREAAITEAKTTLGDDIEILESYLSSENIETARKWFERTNHCWKDDKHKYIATAIEACLGAMYMNKEISWKNILTIVKTWKEMIDNQENI